MNLNFDLKSLDFNNIGDWPIPAKAGVIALLCAAVLAAGYYLDIQGQQQILEQKQSQETTLKSDYETKQAKAASLDAYRAQMKEMEESFGTMLRQLPNKNEVADLLVDITQTGLAAGLEFQLFQPKAEISKDFFAELPIMLQVSGNYHQLGEFVSGIAALPRIVTIHDIIITSKSGKPGDLSMQATAMTYRYLDSGESQKRR
jgi:type IV pilus assembly protein PilO